MKIITVTRKTLIELWREPQLLLLFLFFPALMVVIYFVAFGPGTQGLGSFLKLAILNQDRGVYGARLVERLRGAEYDGAPLFGLEPVSSHEAAETDLMENREAALLVIPPDFSEQLTANGGGDLLAKVTLRGDPSSDSFVFLRSMLGDAIQSFVDENTGWKRPIDVQYQFVTGTGTVSDFQFGIPGLVVFGIMFGAITAAMILVREDISGTLQRIRLSRANAGHLLAGITLVTVLLTCVQMPLTFLIALGFGFQTLGSVWAAMAIGVVLSLTASGLGFITACFARSDGEAVNLATMLLLPFVFLSGAIFPMPEFNLGTVAGHAISLYDVFSSTPAVEAMRKVLIYGDGLSSVTFEIALTVVLSLLYLGLGVWLYQRLRLRETRSRRVRFRTYQL